MKNCEEHIYDTTGTCEWARFIEKKWVWVKQVFSKCKECGGGKVSEPELKE